MSVARLQLLEELLRLALRQDHLVRVRELLLEPLGRLAAGAPGLELLQDLMRVALAQANFITRREELFDPLAHEAVHVS